MLLTFVRHTQPDIGSGVCYGRTDLALSETFADDARKVLEQAPQVDRIVSSPLQRCRRLADYIGIARGQPVQVDARLLEMDFGTWEGRLWADIPRADLNHWADNFLHAKSHGGESVAMLHQRVKAALDDYQASGNSYLVVTHAGVIKAAFADGNRSENFSTRVGFGEMLSMPLAKCSGVDKLNRQYLGDAVL